MKNVKKSTLADIMVLIFFLIFVYFMEYMLYHDNINPPSAYNGHIMLARVWATTGRLGTPHFLYQSLVIVAVKFFYPRGERLDYLAAGQLVSLNVYLILFLLQYLMFRLAVRRDGLRYSLLAAFMALAFMIISPINILYFWDKHAYFGYLFQETYNVPTHPLLKMLALPMFFVAETIFLRVKSANKYLISVAAILSVLVTLAKPSFSVILLPSAGLLVGYKLIRGEYINWQLLLFGLLAPTVIVLGWQYSVTYGSNWQGLNRQSNYPFHIGFAPFAQFERWKVPLVLLLPKLVLSILFPLVVYVAYWKHATRDFRFNFAWLIFAFGCFSTYLFAEIQVDASGTLRIGGAGNLTWSGLIGVFILFIAAGLFFVKKNLEKQSVQEIEWIPFGASILALALHIIYGIIWYFTQFQLFTKIRY